jgi:hypothetical protein
VTRSPKGHVWNLSNWTCSIVTASMVINLSTGSRKGEGDVDHDNGFDRAAVSYCIGGRT